MTNQQGAPEALRPIQRFNNIFGLMNPEARGLYVRYEDHVAALVDAQQPATSAACPVDNNNFDHQTAADVLNGKTVSDEVMRKFVAVARWAHDDRVGLRATLLSVRGELASREAEIALLKKALMDAEAPQPSPTPQADSQPVLPEITAEDRSFLHYNPNTDDIVEWVQHYASAAITADRAARAQADSVRADSVTAPAATTPTAASIAWTALRDLTDPLGEAGVKIMGHVRIYAQRQYEAGLTEGRATPPAQAADSVLEDAARYCYLRDVPMAEWPDELATAFQLQQNAIWDAAIDAAIAAQGGKV